MNGQMPGFCSAPESLVLFTICLVPSLFGWESDLMLLRPLPWFWLFSCERLRNCEECFLILTHGFMRTSLQTQGFPGGSVANAGNAGSIPGSRRSPGGRNGRPLQYSCLKNPMDKEAWPAIVHGVGRSRTGRSH